MNNNNDDISLVNRQYGKWNAILATNKGASYVFRQNHSKIFPETLENWVTAIKKAVIYQTFSPVRLDIDITNSCSNNCIMCFSRELREQCKDTIPLEKLMHIFNDFKSLGGKSVRLTGGGDPLNHSFIIEVIEQLSRLGFKITIETNGDRLSPAIVDVIAKHVHHLRISFDSFDNTSREIVHRTFLPSATYDSLIQKIKLLRTKASSYNRGEKLFIGATFVILPENFSGVNKFVRDMHDAEVSWVAIRKNIYREIYEKYPDIIPFVEENLSALKKEFATYDNFTIEEQYGVSFQPKNDFTTCWVSHVRPIVLADASLQLCCLARNGIIKEAHIGTLPESTNPMSQLLATNAEAIDNFRSAVPGKCKICIDKDNNISLSNMASLLKIDENFEFSKAMVSLGDNKEMYTDSNEIRHIILSKKQYAAFQEGRLTKI